MLKTIVLAYGGPGAGKDAVAKLLHNEHQWGHASMSRSLRQVDESFALLGIMETISQGGIVGLDIVMPAFQLKLAEFSRVKPSNGNLFFQGVLRSTNQVGPQIKLAKHYARRVVILKLNLTDEKMLSRILKRGEDRSDDNEFVAKNRINEFRRSAASIDKCVEATSKKYPNVFTLQVNADQSLERTVERLIRFTSSIG